MRFIKIKKTSRVFFYSVFSILLFILSLYLKTEANFNINNKKQSLTRQYKIENIDLAAKSVLVYDLLNDEVLYSKNEQVVLPIASITKLMTVYCGLSNMDQNVYVPITKEVFEPQYNTGTTSIPNNTKDNELWTFRDLSIYTLIESSNLGAELISKTIGEEKMIQCMNTKSIEMGLFNSKFYNVTGLDIDTTNAGAYSNASEVSIMLKKVYSSYPEIIGKSGYSEYVIYSKNGKLHKAINTNLVTNQTIGILASKTGTTDLAGANLAYITNVGLDHKVIVVLLGSTVENRFVDALTINKSILQSFLK